MSTLKVTNLQKLDGSTFPVGKIGQVVSTTKTDTFSTSSTSYVDVTGLSLSITPSATSSKVFILVNLSLSPTAQAFYNIVRDSTNIAQPTSAGSNQATGGVFFNAGDGFTYINSSVLDSPNTTSATTYKIQMKSTSSNADINKRYSDTFITCVSTITAMEVLA
jgi:hypothetical protein